MKLVMILTLCLGSALAAQDGGKRKVEGALKRELGSVPEKFDLAGTGIAWVQGLEAARGKGRPILLFQLLGNFDDVYC